jgi:hypothetical protein
MKKLLLLIFLIGLVSPALAQNDRSTYLWNTTSLVAGLGQRSSLCIATRTQYQAFEDSRELTYLDCSFIRTMNSWLRLGLAFRTVQTPKETGDVYEYRPQLITTVYNNRHQLQYRSTNRLEHRSFNKGDAHFRYYHNIIVDFPAFAPKVPRIFLEEELFTKLNRESFHLARVYGGLHIYEQPHFVVDLFYIWQQTKAGGEWAGSDVFGLNLTFKI